MKNCSNLSQKDWQWSIKIEFFQYISGDLVYIISQLTSQLRTASRKMAIKYVGPLVIYKIIDPHDYLLMTLDGKILRGFLEHERLKPAIIGTSHGNVHNLAQPKPVMTLGMVIQAKEMSRFITLNFP